MCLLLARHARFAVVPSWPKPQPKLLVRRCQNTFCIWHCGMMMMMMMMVMIMMIMYLYKALVEIIKYVYNKT